MKIFYVFFFFLFQGNFKQALNYNFCIHYFCPEFGRFSLWVRREESAVGGLGQSQHSAWTSAAPQLQRWHRLRCRGQLGCTGDVHAQDQEEEQRIQEYRTGPTKYWPRFQLQTGDKFAQTQAPRQRLLQHVLLPQGCTGTFWPQAKYTLYCEPPNYYTSISSLLPPSHGVTWKGAGTVFLKDGKLKATACRGLTCRICAGLHRFIWMWTLKASLVKQWKNPICLSRFNFNGFLLI